MRSFEEIMDETGELTKRRVVTDGETRDEFDIYCPYCGEIFYDGGENFPRPGCDNGLELQCGECERYFNATASIRYATRKLK